MLKNRKVMLVLLVIALGVGAFWYFGSTRPAQDSFPTERVQRGDVSETVSVTGELVPTEYADLSFPGSGVVDAVFVAQGDQVEAGTKLASLDRMVLFSQLKEARVALRIAEENEKLALRQRSVNTPEERAAKKLATEEARRAADTLVAQMHENVLLSPLSGAISRLDVRVGEVLLGGTVIARVIKEGDYQIEARVPESDIAKVTLGMQAKITFDALTKNEVFDGEVTAIDPAATVVQDVVSYVVTFRLAHTDERLREGMTANIDVATAKRVGVLWVPFRALTKEGGSVFAQVKQADGTLKKVSVVTGLEGDEGTIEVQSGLQEGDEVAIGTLDKP